MTASFRMAPIDPDRPGQGWIVEIGGVDVAAYIDRVAFDMDVNTANSYPRVAVALNTIGPPDLNIPRADVRLPPEQVELLVALGWTPPPLELRDGGPR